MARPRSVREEALRRFHANLGDGPHTAASIRQRLLKEFGYLSRSTCDQYISYLESLGAIIGDTA